MKTTEQPREDASALLEAAAVLLEGAEGSLLTTSLNKALFYLDLLALRETGKTVTGETYVALKAGPVIESYRARLISELERNNIAMQDDDNPSYMPVVLLHPVKPKHLDDAVLKIAKDVGRWAKSKQAIELSNFSHENMAWQIAWNGGAGQGTKIDLRIAMQQLMDGDPWMSKSDPWMSESMTSEEKAAFDDADDDKAEAW